MKRKFRLVRSDDFQRVRREGVSYAHPFAILLIAENVTNSPRVGISVNRAIGNAVKRNRVKRQIRAIINEILPNIKKNCDAVIIVRPTIQKAEYTEIKNAMVKLFDRTGLLK